MTCFIEIKITVDGDVYRYSGNDVNRTIKNAKRMYMTKMTAGNRKNEKECEEGQRKIQKKRMKGD